MGIHFQYQLKLLYIILYISIIIIIREINFDSKGLYVLFEITDTLNIPTILSFLQIFGIFLHKKKKKKKFLFDIRETFNNSSNILANSIEHSFNNLKNLKSKKYLKVKFYSILFLCGFFEGMRYYLSISLLIGKKDISYYISGFFSLELLMFSYLILNFDIYYHHFFSVILFFICDILLALQQCLKLDTLSFFAIIEKFFNNTLYYFLGFFFPIIKIVLEKYLIRDLEMNIFVILHYEGIIQLVGFLFLNLIYIFCDIFINKKPIYLIDQKLFLKEIYTHWILFLFYCILMLTIKILELVINKEFGPFYFILASSAFIFERYYNYILSIFDEKVIIKYLALDLTYYIGYTIGVLIFSEIIILDFCGCNNIFINIPKPNGRDDLTEITDFLNNMDNSSLSY